MKYIITERQSRLLEEPEKVLKIPSLKYFNNDWKVLQNFLENRGNPPYSISDNVYLAETPIESLGNLIKVRGNLYLYKTPIKSLGNLEYVGGYLDLRNSSIKSLGNLIKVRGNLYLRYTPLSETTSEDEIRSKVNVEGDIYL